MSSNSRQNTWDSNAIGIFKKLKLNKSLELQQALMTKYVVSGDEPGKRALEQFIKQEVKLWEN